MEFVIRRLVTVGAVVMVVVHAHRFRGLHRHMLAFSPFAFGCSAGM
jgi:hypothetical protein